MTYKRFEPYSPSVAAKNDDPRSRYDFAPDSDFGKIERAMDGMKCGNNCGGTVTMQNSLMMCSVCKYGASIKLNIDDTLALK